MIRGGKNNPCQSECSCNFWDGTGWSETTSSSLPLDGPRRLARHVIDDAVDALHLIDDARRRAAEKPHVERIKIRRHAVHGGDGAQRADEFIGAPVGQARSAARDRPRSPALRREFLRCDGQADRQLQPRGAAMARALRIRTMTCRFSRARLNAKTVAPLARLASTAICSFVPADRRPKVPAPGPVSVRLRTCRSSSSRPRLAIAPTEKRKGAPPALAIPGVA